MSTGTGDMPIDELLARIGLSGQTALDARGILETEGLTNPRKQRMASSKLPLARAAIDRRWQRLCHHCRARATGDRVVVLVPSAACSACGGSHNARAVRDMTAACRRADVQRIVIVGGSPSTRQQLGEMVGAALELRLV